MTSPSDKLPSFLRRLPAEKKAYEKIEKIDPWKCKPTLASYPQFFEPENKYDAGLASALTDAEIGEALDAHTWKYARTMPLWPHDYILRQNWKHPIPWENVVQHMRCHGKSGWFRSKPTAKKTPNLYWVWGGNCFWTMGCELHVTTVINRQIDCGAEYYYYDPHS